MNITEDHLNRHHTMEEYIRVKELITGNQTKDQVCVLNYEDEVLRTFGESGQVKAKSCVFFQPQRTSTGYFSERKRDCFKSRRKRIRDHDHRPPEDPWPT